MSTTETPTEYPCYPGVPRNIVDAIEWTGEDYICLPVTWDGPPVVTVMSEGVEVTWEAEGDPDGTLYTFAAYDTRTDGPRFCGSYGPCGSINFWPL